MADDRSELATRQEIAAAGYWFGPRSGRFSWGWAPVSWKGWAVIALVIPYAVAAEIVGRTERQDALYAIPLLAVIVGLCIWKGTAPGPSRKATRQLQDIARQQRGL